MPPYEILSILLGFLPCQHSDVFRNHTNLLQKSLAGMSLLGNNILEIKLFQIKRLMNKYICAQFLNIIRESLFYD